MYKKFELFIIITVSLILVGSATLNGMSTLAQSNITNSSKIGGDITNASEIGANVTAKGTVGATYGGVDIDSKSGVIKCDGEIKGPVKTEGIQADAFVRHGKFAGAWIILSEKTGQDKGGADRGGWTDGKKYQIKGVEQYDGICKAKLPNDITISGDCGTGVEIKYSAVDGNNDTFKGNARCYVSTANFTSKAVNATGTQGSKTGNTTEPLNLTAKMHELQNANFTSEAVNVTGTQGSKTGNTTEPLNLTAKMQDLQK